MLEAIDFNAPEFPWRVGSSIGILIVAIGFVWLIAHIRHLMCKKTRAASSVTAAKPPGRFSQGLLSLAVVGVAGWVLLQVWGIDTNAWLASDGGFGLRSVIRAVIIIALAAIAIELTSFAAQLLIGKIGGHTRDRRRVAKLRTIAPLISGLANAIILLVAISMVLSEAGIQIAPLLAGAGVAGIAIGFGAQSLVKDLFTGAFLIIEDIVSHGDVVEISGVVGTVEALTLRTIRVRSYDGTLHIFPFGEAQVIHNKTSRFSCFAFELQISYLSNIDTAIRVVEQVGDEIAADKELASCLIGKLDLAGVDRLSDNGVILKGKIKTVAGENGRVGTAFLKRVKERLDEAGVLIAHRHLPVPPYDTIRDFVAAPREDQPAVAKPN